MGKEHRKKKADFMDHVTVEEHSYGEGKRERLDYIYTKACKSLNDHYSFYIHGGGWIAETRVKAELLW